MKINKSFLFFIYNVINKTFFKVCLAFLFLTFFSESSDKYLIILATGIPFVVTCLKHIDALASFLFSILI